MSRDLFQRTPLQESIRALEADLVHEGGPRISTMRNYRFAILVYRPHEEFRMRKEVRRLTRKLREPGGWNVLPLSLHSLLLDRARKEGDDWIRRVTEMERRTYESDPERALEYLRNRFAPLIEGPDGIAADCAERIQRYAEAHPDQADHTLVLIGRAGALYPFFRASSLLKHLDGRTNEIPVVLLYPGERVGETGLRFMEQLDADNDYRPRIYG